MNLYSNERVILLVIGKKLFLTLKVCLLHNSQHFKIFNHYDA